MTALGKGLRRSAPSRTAHLQQVTLYKGGRLERSRLHTALATSIPSDVDLGAFTPRLRTIDGRTGPADQGPTSACTWHALPFGLSTACAAQGFDLPWVPSMDLGYKTMRAKERSSLTPSGTVLYDLEDTGGELSDAVDVAAEYGVVPLGKPALDGRYSDIDPLWINDEPSPTLLQEAGLTLVTGPYSIDPNDPNVMGIIAACLGAKIPIYVGFYCDTAFENTSPGGVATAPIVANRPGEGGHAVYLSAARTNGASREVRIENSWGHWCDGGTVWADEKWVRACWELRPLLIQHVAPRTA